LCEIVARFGKWIRSSGQTDVPGILSVSNVLGQGIIDVSRDRQRCGNVFGEAGGSVMPATSS